MQGDTVYGLGTIILALLLIIFGPLMFIWSLNTLFPVLVIPYTWKTWIAAIVVGGIVKGSQAKTEVKKR